MRSDHCNSVFGSASFGDDLAQQLQQRPVLGTALVLEEQIHAERAVAVLDAVHEVGIGGAQIGRDVAVFADLQRVEIDLGPQVSGEVSAQEVRCDLAAAEALAKEGVVG